MKLNATENCDLEWSFLMASCALNETELENYNSALNEMGYFAKGSFYLELNATGLNTLANCNSVHCAPVKYIQECLLNESLQEQNNFRWLSSYLQGSVYVKFRQSVLPSFFVAHRGDKLKNFQFLRWRVFDGDE